MSFGLVFCSDRCHNEPGGGAAAKFREDQVGSIGLVYEYHVNGMVFCDAAWVCRQVFEYNSGFGVGVFGRGGLFR